MHLHRSRSLEGIVNRTLQVSLTTSPAAPSPSASTNLSSSRSLRSHSDASLPASSSAGTLLFTSVAERKSCTAWLHLPSARRSRIFHRLFHLPVSLYTSDHRIFCWAFHPGRTLKRCSRVWVWYRHHQHWGWASFMSSGGTAR